MSAASEYLKWRRQAAVGCVFARLMSSRPADFGQRVEEVAPGQTPSQLAAMIAARIEHLAADPMVTAVTLVFPGVDDLRHLTQIALALRDQPRWAVKISTLQPPPVMDMVTVSITRELAFGDGYRPSEALVLGPFQEFPSTRRAPVTALEIFVGEPLPQDPKTHEPTTRANLAHMDLMDRDIVNRDLTQAQMDGMWERSVAGRRQSLGDHEDRRAKAKVSFVIPRSLARELGCEP